MNDTAPVRLLIVDDEAALREPLAEYLSRQGFDVAQAASAAEARSQIRDDQNNGASPDLVLLDIMMPGEDGLSLCRHLVESRAIPTIFLTAKGEATDRIVGLEIGADDYVVKPFEPRELVARIRSVLRRAGRSAAAPENELFEFEGWKLDPLKRRLIDPEGAIVVVARRQQAERGRMQQGGLTPLGTRAIGQHGADHLCREQRDGHREHHLPHQTARQEPAYHAAVRLTSVASM